jgi:hypothetical protein
MQVIGLILAIGLMALQQEEVPADLSPQIMQAVGNRQECVSSNVSRVSQSSDSAEVAADDLLEYSRDQQRTTRAAMSLELNRRMGRDGEDTTNSLETMLVMRARQNILARSLLRASNSGCADRFQLPLRLKSIDCGN